MSDRTPDRYLSERAGASNGRQSSQRTNSESDDSRRSQDNNQRPLILDEIPSHDCPVCLNRIENRALTNTCQHEFCFPCIQQWSRSHNRCPVCRAVYQRIYHNIRSESDYDEEEVAEPWDLRNGLLFLFGETGILVTPTETGVYIITRRQTSFGARLNIEFAGPGQVIPLPNFFEQNTVISSPENLDETVRNLNVRYRHPHHGSHPGLWPHRRHRR